MLTILPTSYTVMKKTKQHNFENNIEWYLLKVFQRSNNFKQIDMNKHFNLLKCIHDKSENLKEEEMMYNC